MLWKREVLLLIWARLLILTLWWWMKVLIWLGSYSSMSLLLFIIVLAIKTGHKSSRIKVLIHIIHSKWWCLGRDILCWLSWILKLLLQLNFLLIVIWILCLLLLKLIKWLRNRICHLIIIYLELICCLGPLKLLCLRLL